MQTTKPPNHQTTKTTKTPKPQNPISLKILEEIAGMENEFLGIADAKVGRQLLDEFENH